MLPNEIMAARYPRAIQRLMGIQGEPPAPQLSGEIQPSVDLPTGHEIRWLLGETLCSCFFDQTGDATHPGLVQLYNPTSSNILAIVDAIDFVALAAGTGSYVELRDDNAGTLVANVTSGRMTDLRWRRTANCLIRGSTTNAATGTILQYLGVGRTHQPKVILFPGTYISLVTPNNAERVIGYVSWRERVYAELERRIP